MTKQEKIDWGLRNLIREWTNEEGSKYLYEFSKAIRAYLHSQNVVIKVDRGVKAISITEEKNSVIIPVKLLERAGYVAVGPLEVKG